MNEIICGNFTLTDQYIVSGNCCLQHAKSGESLAYDTLDVVVHFDRTDVEIFFDANDNYVETSDDNRFLCRINSIVFEDEFTAGKKAVYKYDGKIIEEFYVSKLVRVGKSKYNLHLVSAIGMLENSMHFGGIYTGETLSTVLADIFDGLTYTVDPLVADLKLYGWLPYDTKRNNLQQITIATNLAVMKNIDGSVRITALSKTNMGSIDKSRIGIGGKVDTANPCTAVKVVEHTFTPNDEAITLADASFTGTKTIIFSEPAHSLTINNGTIVSSNANYAIINGGGSVLLTGKKYTHTRKEVVEGTINGDLYDNIVTIQNATLINTLNSSTIAQRLFDYYSTVTTITEDMTFGDEKVGNVYTTVNPYTEDNADAFLFKLDVDMSKTLKATASFLQGFEPQGAYSGYENRVLIDSNQTFTVPAGVTEIRAVLIGGGSGGQGGFSGAKGSNGSRGSGGSGNVDPNSPGTYVLNGEGGNGGNGGSGGTAAKVNDLGALTATPGSTFAITVGSAGTGGAAGGTAGASGGNTTFGVYSSAAGLSPDVGYIDIVTGTIYARPGSSGVAGGKGRGKSNPLDTISLTYNGNTYTNGNNGLPDREQISAGWVWAIGGNGGGPAVGANGNNGGNGYAAYNRNYGDADGGDGASGATASIPGSNASATSYGSAGGGGHGGGGGGGGGAWYNPNGGSYEWPGFGGGGGSGSAGGNGAPGCVIIYY